MLTPFQSQEPAIPIVPSQAGQQVSPETIPTNNVDQPIKFPQVSIPSLPPVNNLVYPTPSHGSLPTNAFMGPGPILYNEPSINIRPPLTKNMMGLLPCPMCGSNDVQLVNTKTPQGLDTVIVKCFGTNCIEGNMAIADRDDAIFRWNRLVNRLYANVSEGGVHS